MKRHIRTLTALAVALLMIVASGCSKKSKGNDQEQGAMDLKITSTAFEQGDTVPVKYTCSGEDISPPLSIEGAPEGTRSFALIMDDPDAPGQIWVHWVVANLPDSVTSIPEGASGALPGAAVEGVNSWEKTGYGGPCPPPGHGVHHYYFKLYALDTTLDVDATATKGEVVNAMSGHILAQAELMGTFEREE